LAFKVWNHIPEIHALNGRVTYYITPAAHKEFPTVEDFLSKAWGTPPPPDANAKSKPFTLEMAIAMQEELIAGYSSAAFQEALKQFAKDAAGDGKKLRKLISTHTMEMVQSKVFPRYGFEPSPKGVMLSMQAYGPYNNSDQSVFKNNLIMAYLTSADQVGTLEENVQRGMDAAQTAAQQASTSQPVPPAPQQQNVLQNRATPARKAPSQILKEEMRKIGKSTSGVQRVDAQGQNAGWAPTEFIDEVAELYEHGKYLTEQGNFADGETFLREALQLFEEVVGEGHNYTLHCANSLCFTLHEQQRYAEGEPIGKTAVDGFTRALGKRHEHTVAAMNNYALCLQGNGNMAAAVVVLKDILAISEEVSGPKNHATVAVLSNLAETLRQDGQFAEAEVMFRRAYSVQANVHGAESLACAMFSNNLAVCLRDQDKNEEAKYWYGRAVSGLKTNFGADHHKVKLVEKNLQELMTDPNQIPVELPRFLTMEPRKPDDRFHQPSDQDFYKPMSSFSDQGLKDFSKRLMAMTTAIERELG